MIERENAVSAQELENKCRIELGRRVKDLRRQHGLTQTELGEMCGCANETISYLESGGKYAPRVWIIAALARTFGVTVDYLLGLEGAKR